MLTHAAVTRRGLLAADPALPARDLHLDTTWIAARLGELGFAPGAAIAPIRLVRSKYRIGESLRAVHRITVDGEPATVTCRMFPAGGATGAARRSPAALHDTDHSTVWWTFPDDRKLRGIDAVMSAEPGHAAALGIPAWSASEVAEYAPERSLTVRADGDDGRAVAYVKLYAPGTVDVARFAARYDRAAAAFRGTDRTAVPTVLGRTDSMLALSPMPGVPWSRTSSGRTEAVLGHLGEAIARFHGIAPGALADDFGRLRVRRVLHSAELVGTARPDLAGDLAQVAACLASGPPEDDPVVLLHGDCHPKNCLVDGDRLTLIDLDQAGAGSAACDIASMLARLRHGIVLGESTRDEADAAAAAFLAGYASVRHLPSEASLRWHVAAALVAERAIRAVNRVNVTSLERLDGLIALARDAAGACNPDPAVVRTHDRPIPPTTTR